MRKFGITFLVVVAVCFALNVSLKLHIDPEAHEKSTIEDARMSL